jgi:hypothetical protein
MAATFEGVLSRNGVRAKAYARGLAPALGEGPGGREYYVSLDAHVEPRRDAPQIADERHLAANARGGTTFARFGNGRFGDWLGPCSVVWRGFGGLPRLQSAPCRQTPTINGRNCS